MAAAEERWGRFRRLCNLTQELRLHGSDEQSVLLPKLISPAPLPSPPPLSSSTSCGADGLDLFIYANSPGVRGRGVQDPLPQPTGHGSPSPALPVPFEVTLGIIYRQEGGVERSWGLLLPLSPNPHGGSSLPSC